MIKRIWHGFTTPENASVYEKLLRSEVSKGIEEMSIAGLRRFEMLRRDFGAEVEFVTIMEFETLDDIKAFVGDDYERCYVSQAAREVLKRFDERSQHYDILEARTY